MIAKLVSLVLGRQHVCTHSSDEGLSACDRRVDEV